jgi:hypothetical protein
LSFNKKADLTVFFVQQKRNKTREMIFDKTYSVVDYFLFFRVLGTMNKGLLEFND